MREKLVQILMDTRSYGNRSYAELASDIVAELRCDKCKHWGTDDAACSALQGENPLADIHDDYVSRANVFTQPDFFCALWEAK